MDCLPKIDRCGELALVRRSSTVVCNWMDDRELTDLSKLLLLIQIDQSGNIFAAVNFFISVNFCFFIFFFPLFVNINEFETKEK